MKCKTCKKRMQSISTSHDFFIGGNAVKVINIPAKQCPVCEKVSIYEIILGNARRYAHEHNSQIVNYIECEDEENTNLLVSQMFLR